MCRLAAYIGPPTAPETLVMGQSHSLIQQSAQALEAKLAVNGDGFGLAWYGAHEEPGVFRNVQPAWSDENLLSLARHITAPVFLAHVRAATFGEITHTNCHPFTHGRWSFMHNGQIGHFAELRRGLEARLSDPLYLARRGTTDSELLFLLALEMGLEEDPVAALRAVIALLYAAAEAAQVKPFFRLTCVISDGARVIGLRYASDAHAPTLYLSDRLVVGAQVLASEPLDGRPEHWQAVAPGEILVCDGTQVQAYDATDARPQNASAPAQ